MSISGLTTSYIPASLDGLNVIDADQIYIDGQLVNLTDYVPYQGANRTIDAGGQNIQTTHTATATNDVVNKGLLDTTISNLAISIAGSFLDKVSVTPQIVIGNVSYTAQLSADDLLVPATKRATLGSVLSIDANWQRSETDAGVITRQYFGSISSSMGIYQATSTQNFAILQCADLGVETGKRMDITWNLNINEPTYNSSIQLFASSDGVTTNQYLGPSVSFTPSDPLYKVLSGTFIPQYRYLCVLCITSKPGGVQTVRWYGLDLEEQGVELTNVTMPSLTADRVAVFNGNKQLVSSGISTTKLNTLDNVSTDIQTQLNGKLNLSGGTMTGDIVMGSNKVTSTATPTTDDTLTRKGYVDTQDNLRVLKSGDTMTGSLIMGAFKVTSSAIPVIPDDYTNKNYVDTAITGLASTYAKLAGPQTFTGTHTFSNVTPITLSGLTANRLLGLSVAGNVQAVSVTLLEASYLSGVTSGIQGQINAKASTSYVDTQDGLRVLKAGDTMTGTLGLTSTNIVEFGSGVSGKEANAGKIGYQTFTSGCLDMIGAGTTSSDRRIRLFDKVGVGQNPDIGIFHIGKTGGDDFFVLNNATNVTGQYINQRFLFGPTTGTNRSAYIQAYVPATNQTEFRFYVDSGSNVVERLRVSGEGTNGSVYVNSVLGVGVAGTSIDTDLYVYGKGKFYNATAGAPANGINGGAGTRLILWPGNANACPYALGIDGDTLWYGTPAGGIHKWYDGTTLRMILTGGNLGIGTLLPDYPLDVTGAGRVRGSFYVGTEGNASSQIFFGGVSGDSGYDHTVIECRKYNQAGEGSELVLFKGNDIQAGSLVPDRIRLRGANICFDTYPYYSTDRTAENIRMTIDQNGVSFFTAGDSSYSRYGPNTTWNSYLHVGATTNKVGQAETAQVITTNGNLHLDAGYGRDTYINYYQNQASQLGLIFSYGPWYQTGRMSINGNVGIGSDQNTNRLEVYSTTADYTNSVVIKTPWAGITLDNGQVAFGRKWGFFSGGPGAGIGVGNLGIYDLTAGRYCFNIESLGNIMLGSGFNAWTKVGVNGGVTCNTSGGNWTQAGNAVLISQDAVNQGGQSNALQIAFSANESWITSLQPGIAWRNFNIYANQYYFYTTGGLNVYLFPGVAGWITASDEREKEDIQDLKTDKSLKRIMALRPKHYRRKYYDTETPVSDEIKQMRHVGFLAQEVQQSNPHCVSHFCNKEAKSEEDDGDRLGVNYNDLNIHLIGAVQEIVKQSTLQSEIVQEQQRMIDEQTKRIATLEAREVVWLEHAREQEAKMGKMTRDMEKMASLLAQLISKQ